MLAGFVGGSRSYVYTTPEKFKNGPIAPKTHQTFSVHATPEKFENATITGHFGFVFEKNLVREITSSWRHRFRKAPFSKCFPSTLKRKTGVFKFLRFEERCWKAPFSVRRNKVEFSNFFGALWMGLRSVLETWALSRRISPKGRTFEDRQIPAWCTCERHNFRVHWFVLD